MSFDPVLCLVTDRSFRGEAEFLPTIERAVDAGVTWVQYREKAGLSDRRVYELGIALRALARRKRVPLVVNDRLDLAMALDADGVHLGQGDLPLRAAKRLWEPGKIWGVSAATREAAREAREAGADYLGVGAVYPTATKADAAPIEKAALRELAVSSGLPVIAIGGIRAGNMAELRALGCAGVAVVSGIWAAADPAEAVKDFLARWGA